MACYGVVSLSHLSLNGLTDFIVDLFVVEYFMQD